MSNAGWRRKGKSLGKSYTKGDNLGKSLGKGDSLNFQSSVADYTEDNQQINEINTTLTKQIQDTNKMEPRYMDNKL